MLATASLASMVLIFDFTKGFQFRQNNAANRASTLNVGWLSFRNSCLFLTVLAWSCAASPRPLPSGDSMQKQFASLFFRSRLRVILTALALVLVVGLADYYSGYEISLSIFYLLAIAFALWNQGT